MNSIEASKALQEDFDSSPFEDIKFFIEPSVKASMEACTAEALEILPQLVALNSGEKEAEYVF